MASPPYMPLYIADYLSATEHLDAAMSGAYLHLLMHYWQKATLPTDDRFLARIARMTDRQWASAKPVIKSFFDDGWRQSRLESERANAVLKAEARAKSGSHGGTAKSLNLRNSALANATAELQQTYSKPVANGLASSSGLKEERKTSSSSLAEPPTPDIGRSSENLPSPLDEDTGKPKERRSRMIARAESDQALLDRITDMWNSWAVKNGSPQVKYLTGERAKHCRKRILDIIGNGTATPEEAFQSLLSRCYDSFFVKGKPRNPLKFDQLLREGFMVQMMEGQFAYQQRGKTWQN